MAQVDPKRLARYKAEMEAQEARKAEKKTFTKVDFFQPPKNVAVLIRVLPGQDPGSIDKDYYVEIWQHFNVSPSAKFPVTCPRTLDADAECPICSKVRQLYSTKNPQDKISADKMRGKPRYMMAVVPLQGFADDVLGKILVWPAPMQVRDRIQVLFGNPDYGDITHPTEGYDCWLTVTGSEMNIKYSLDPVKNPTPLSDDPAEIELVLQAQPALYKYRFAAPNEQLRKFMLGETNSITQHVDPAEGGEAEAPDEDESVLSQVAPAPASVEGPSTGRIQTATPNVSATAQSEPSPTTPFDPPAAAPAPVAAAPKRAKFDVSAIKAQVANIKANAK